MKIHDGKSFNTIEFNNWKSSIKQIQASQTQTVINSNHNNIAAYHTNNHSNTAQYTTYNYTPHTNSTTSLDNNISDQDFIVGDDNCKNKDNLSVNEAVGQEYTQAIVHPHINSGHSNNISHTNYGFTHNNAIPTTPAIYNISDGDRFKDEVTIGYFSYDRDNDTVYYHIQYRQIGNLDGSANLKNWIVITNNTTSNTYRLQTSGLTDGLYEFQIKAYNSTRSENGMSKEYISGVKSFKVVIQQNKAPQILNIKGTTITTNDIVSKWANNMPPDFTYKVYDYDNNQIISTHYIDGQNIGTTTNNNGDIVRFLVPTNVWDSLSVGNHKLKIEITDGMDPGTPIEKDIIKLDDRLLFVTQPYETETLAIKVNVALLKTKEEGDILQLWVCNNAFDENPNWEDCTKAYTDSIEYIFANTTKTNAKAGISMKVLLKKSFAKN